jgi:hypothetical protein
VTGRIPEPAPRTIALDHDLPVQCCASSLPVLAVVLGTSSAHAFAGDVAAIPLTGPDGAGMACHALPFHRLTSALLFVQPCVPSVAHMPPATQMSDVLTAETDMIPEPPAPAG